MEYLMRGLLAVKQRGSIVFLALPDMSVATGFTGIKSFTRRTGDFLELADYAPGYNLIKVWRCPTLLENIVKDEQAEEDVVDGPKVEEDDLEDEIGYESLGVIQPIVFSVGSTSNDTMALNSRKPANFFVITKISKDTEYLMRGLLAVRSLDRRTGYFLELAHYAPEDESRCESLGVLKPIVFYVDSSSNDMKTNRMTTVLWDVEDYPLPSYFTLFEIFEKIKHSLELGCDCNLCIWAYVPDYLLHVYEIMAERFRYEKNLTADRFCFVPKVPRDKYSRLSMMTLDLLLWAIDNPLGLDARGFTVFLVLPGAVDVAPKEAPDLKILLWEDLWSRRISKRPKCI
ncbi:unnamed protein product [Arabis nemorensis]|uniref:NYN domain-containing protein n=1 Tax=Arabis nemorensis TaxID=586526 RepID=A0A565CGP7_9BRAS|nr:unnamed protein product [Arabis nemorensis]